MNRVNTTSAEAEAYLAAVRAELGHLSEEERGDLLEDLARHLAEVAVDDAAEEPLGLVARLGAPAQYAAELRAAAGLPARAESDPQASPSSTTAGLFSEAARLTRSAWDHTWARETRSFLRQLAPAWWLLRGYLVVALVTWRTPDGANDFPVPTVGRSTMLGVAAVLVAVVASIALGRRALTPVARVFVVALDVVVVIGAVAVLTNVQGRMIQPQYVQVVGENNYALASPSGPVTNIYPYSRDGQPLTDVLLFDQDGRPLRTAFQEWWPDGCARTVDYPRAADGVPVEFAYPAQYVLRAGAQSSLCAAGFPRPPVPLPTLAPPGG